MIPALAAAGATVGGYAVSALIRGGASTGDHLVALALALAAGGATLATLTRFNRTLGMAAGEITAMAEAGEVAELPLRNDLDPALAQLIRPMNRLLSRCEEDLRRCRDDNRRLQIQARLHENEKHVVEMILDAMTDGVVVSDCFDEIRLVNAAAAEELGFDADEAARKPLKTVLDDSELLELIAETRTRGVGGRQRIFERTIENGPVRRVLRFALQKTDFEGDRAGVMTIVRDISREAEAARVQNDFLSGVTHELRSPLAGIQAYVEMLRDGEAADEETRQDFYGIIAGQTNRLNRLIDNILNIARIEAGVLKVSPEPIELTGVVKSALDIARPQAAAKKIQVAEKLAPVFSQVQADPDMISQAVLNLLSNAIKYTPEGGSVTVSTGVDEAAGVVRIAVADTGVGISKDDLPRLFQKFYRVESSKNMAKGAGLGLNLVLNIVENLHGGQLKVDSEPGRGSEFVIELPML